MKLKKLQLILFLIALTFNVTGIASAQIPKAFQEKFNSINSKGGSEALTKWGDELGNKNDPDFNNYNEMMNNLNGFEVDFQDAYADGGMEGVEEFGKTLKGNPNAQSWFNKMKNEYRKDESSMEREFENAVKSGGDAALEELRKKLIDEQDPEKQDIFNRLMAKRNRENEAKQPPKGPPAGSKDRPYDLSDLEVETDADGNIKGFKEKDFEAKDTDGDGKISDEERAAWEKKKAEEKKRGGGGPGGGPGGAGGGGGGGQLPKNEWYKLQCWVCDIPPKKFGCDQGVPGDCGPGVCSIQDQECKAHTEVKPDGSKITCHLCEEPPPPMCIKYGYYGDPNCGGKCDDGRCEPVWLDPTGRPQSSTVTKNDTKCYKCSKKSECVDKGLFDDPACAGKCVPTNACEKVYLDMNGGIMGPNQTRTRDAKACYRCRYDDDMRPQCARGYDDPACYGQCSQYECKTTGQYVWRGQIYYCYGCEINLRNPCTDGGVLDANCGGACRTDEICKAAYPTTVDGKQAMCHMCQKRTVTGGEVQCDGAYLNDPSCAHDCDSDECVLAQTVTHNGQQVSCYNCQKKETPPPPPPKECRDGTPDPSCQGYCETKDCNVVGGYADPVTGKQINCYSCKWKQEGCNKGTLGSCDIAKCDQGLHCYDHQEMINGQPKICHVCSGSDVKEKFCRYGGIGSCDVAQCSKGMHCSEHLEKYEGKTIICHQCTALIDERTWTDPPHQQCSSGSSGRCRLGNCSDDKLCVEHTERDALGNEHVCWSCSTHRCRDGYPGSCDIAKCTPELGGTYCRDHVEAFEGREYICYTCGGNDDKTCEDQQLRTRCSTGERCVPVTAKNGKQCCNCVSTDAENCDKIEAFVGGCPGRCETGQICVPVHSGDALCHQCDKYECEDAGFEEKCDDTEICNPLSIESGLQCCECQPKPKEKDPCEGIQCPAETDCKTFNCVQGECVAENKSGSCDDKDACTSGDQCTSGACIGQPVQLSPSTLCVAYSCDSATGIKKEIKAGAQCDDGDVCTGQDQCDKNGVCKGRTITGCGENRDCAENVPGSTASADCSGQCPKDRCESIPVYGDPSKPKGIAYYCYKCNEGGCTTDAECDDSEFCNGAETCTGGECMPGDPPCHGQICDEDSDSCVDCRTDEDCEDDGEFCNGGVFCHRGECVSGGDPCEPDETCDEPTDQCLKPTALQPECPQGTAPGVCDSHSCSSDQECVTVGDECHKCKAKKKTCVDMGLNYGDECNQQCYPLGGTCKQKTQDDFGMWCWECNKSSTPQCAQGTHPGPCPGSCSSEQNCVQADNNCYSCRPKSMLGDCPVGMWPPGCGKGVCPQGEDCINDPNYPNCHFCERFELPPPCPQGTANGPCGPNSCPAGQACVAEGTYCHKCRVKTGGVQDGGDIGVVPGGGGAASFFCEQGQMLWEDCQACHAKGNRCRLAPLPAIAVGFRPPCYICEPLDTCAKYGQVSACQMCPPNHTCIPGRPLLDPETGDIFFCKNCVPGQVAYETTYVIIIIETPRGRYILDDEKKGTMDLGDFKASQVMQMAKASSAQDAVSRIGSMLPTGGMNLPGIISGGMSMGDMSGLLKQGMEKGRTYGDNCFGGDENIKEEKIPDVPPPANPAKTAADAGPEKSEFGQSPAKEIPADGPMVACGEKDGQKALAVMDAHGRPVDYIFKDMLQKDPNAIMNAIQKAQSLSDQIAAASKGDFSGIIQTAQQKVISKVTQTIDTKISGFFSPEDESEPVEPNDPFYRPPEAEHKKKKLLGIIGSDKAAAAVTIGSKLKMGKTTMGATEGMYDREDNSMAWQWGVHQVGYTPLADPTSAWNLVDETKRNVIVAVIDSGLDLKHQDAPEYIWKNEHEIPGNGQDDDGNGYVDDVNGWNFLDNNNDVTDLAGHGSFVTGIIAAKTNNGFGMAGINPGAVIMPIKVANEDGATNSFFIARAIYYAVDNGAEVINLSLGARVRSRLEEMALNYAWQKGVFVAAAAGNVGEDIQEHGPASQRGAFAVGSIDFEGNRSTISNFGANNGLLAPGDRIISMIASGTGKKLTKSVQKAGFYPQSGTSFSTPMVAATASLLLAQNSGLSNLDIEDILHRTATEMYEPGWDEFSGAGLLNAKAALSEDVNGKLTVKVTEININQDDKGNVTTVDVYATVRGDVQSFVVELGKGARASKFEQVSGPYTQQAAHNFVAQLSKKEHLKGSREWVIRVVATDRNGVQTIAKTPLLIK